MAQGGEVACLLVHGINGTPYDLADLATEIETLGIHTETLLLPGHDVQPWIARDFGWDDWMAAVEAAFESLAQRFDRVILVGHSMGGALLLHLAATDPRVAAIATLCAPAELHAGLLPLARHGHRLLPYLPRIFEDIRDHHERWRYMVRRNVWYVPTKPMYSLLQALPRIRLELGQVKCPALVVAAHNDHIVPVRDGHYIYAHIGSQEKSFVLLRHSWHVVTRDLERDIVSTEVLGFLRRQVARFAAGPAESSLATPS